MGPAAATTSGSATTYPPPSSPCVTPATIRLIFVCSSNVCRSPLAAAVAMSHVHALGLAGKVEVGSRGLTDHYSPWGTRSEPHMRQAAADASADERVLEHLSIHQAQPLQARQVADPHTYLFMATQRHAEWLRDEFDTAVVDQARRQGRVLLFRMDGKEVDDPWQSGQAVYHRVCREIMTEVPRSLDALFSSLRLR